MKAPQHSTQMATKEADYMSSYKLQRIFNNFGLALCKVDHYSNMTVYNVYLLGRKQVLGRLRYTEGEMTVGMVKRTYFITEPTHQDQLANVSVQQAGELFGRYL